jgi:hypothetical protein
MTNCRATCSDAPRQPTQHGRLTKRIDCSCGINSAQRPPSGAGIQFAVAIGWLRAHESGAYYRFSQPGTDMFA